jgi:hypothetical protein
MRTPFSRTFCLALLATAVALCTYAPAFAHPIDRFFVIYMENHSYDEVIARLDTKTQTILLTPFITKLSTTEGNALNAYGVSQPSLPNYLALLAGKTFGVQDDNDSCFAMPLNVTPCHRFGGTNLIDEIETSGRTWADYNQSMPSIGFLGDVYPKVGDGLYRQKHNPFVYFTDIVKNPSRLARVKTFDQLQPDLALGPGAPQFVFITPDECHDMHGSTPFCQKFDPLLVAGDAEIRRLVEVITDSPAFTQNSVIIITWDEGDFSNQGCCDSPAIGGGHIPLIVISGRSGAGLTSSTAFNQYSILATIEDAWGLPKLGFTADTVHVKPMFELIH